MSKKLSPIEIRDRKVLRALDRGLSYRQIETKIGVPKSTAFDISVRYGATSVNVAY
jgi:transposase